MFQQIGDALIKSLKWKLASNYQCHIYIYVYIYIPTYLHACIYVCMSYVHSYMPAFVCIFLLHVCHIYIHMYISIFKRHIFWLGQPLICQNCPLNGIWVHIYNIQGFIIIRDVSSAVQAASALAPKFLWNTTIHDIYVNGDSIHPKEQLLVCQKNFWTITWIQTIIYYKVWVIL